MINMCWYTFYGGKRRKKKIDVHSSLGNIERILMRDSVMIKKKKNHQYSLGSSCAPFDHVYNIL
jgi:hypothetical protein